MKLAWHFLVRALRASAMDAASIPCSIIFPAATTRRPVPVERLQLSTTWTCPSSSAARRQFWQELDRELRRLREHIKERPEADIVCFKADERKTGGALVTLSGRVKKIDEYEGRLIMADGSVIAIEDIYGIDLKLGESPAEEED